MRVVRRVYYCQYIFNNSNFISFLCSINFATSIARHHPHILVSKDAVISHAVECDWTIVQSVQFPTLGFVESPAVGPMESGIKGNSSLAFPNPLTPFKLLEVSPIGKNRVVPTSLTSTDSCSNSAFNLSVDGKIKTAITTSLRLTVQGELGRLGLEPRSLLLWIYYIVKSLGANLGCLRSSKETNKRDRGKKRWPKAEAEICASCYFHMWAFRSHGKGWDLSSTGCLESLVTYQTVEYQFIHLLYKHVLSAYWMQSIIVNTLTILNPIFNLILYVGQLFFFFYDFCFRFFSFIGGR